MAYATVDQLKIRLNVESSVLLEEILDAASAEVDGYCGRTFGQLGTAMAPQVRTFTADNGLVCFVDDLVSVTALTTDGDGDRTYETTWSAADFDLSPDNANVKGWPYQSVHVAPLAGQTFPRQRKAVRVSGVWGWPAVPKAVTEATLIYAGLLFKRKDAPFGVLAEGSFGAVVMAHRMDPQVEQLLLPYRALGVLAVGQ